MANDHVTITVSIPDGFAYIGTSRGEGYTMDKAEVCQHMRELAYMLENNDKYPSDLDRIENRLSVLIEESDSFTLDEDGYTWEDGCNFFEYLSDELLHLLNNTIRIIKSEEE